MTTSHGSRETFLKEEVIWVTILRFCSPTPTAAPRFLSDLTLTWMLVVGWTLDKEHSLLILPVLIWGMPKRTQQNMLQLCRVSLQSVFSCLNIFLLSYQNILSKHATIYTEKSMDSSVNWVHCVKQMCLAVREPEIYHLASGRHKATQDSWHQVLEKRCIKSKTTGVGDPWRLSSWRMKKRFKRLENGSK